jgi:hypothetical protein
VIAATDLGVDPVDFSQVAVGRQPTAERIRVEERRVNTLGRSAEDTMESNGVGCIGHGMFLLLGWRLSINRRTCGAEIDMIAEILCCTCL